MILFKVIYKIRRLFYFVGVHKTVPAIILAGGLGTRLRSVDPDKPKPMVEVKGKPFLFWLIAHLQGAGFNNFIFSVGYKAEQILEFDWGAHFPRSRFQFVQEPQPLGTGGAVREVFNAHKNLPSAWIFNGDTLLEKPLPPDFFIPADDDAHYVCLRNPFDAQPNVATEGARVLSADKEGSLFDAGQVFLRREAVEKHQGPTPCSLHQLIHESFKSKRVGFTVVEGTCYDIGTPIRLNRFTDFLAQQK